MRPYRVSLRKGMLLVMAAAVVICQDQMPATLSREASRNVKVLEAYGRIPLHFEENAGQAAAPVRFLARGPGYAVMLTAAETVIAIDSPEPQSPKMRASGDPTSRRRAAMTLKLAGAHACSIKGEDELPGRSNYLRGSDPASWQTDIPLYRQVRYTEVYPDIDLLYYGNPHQLEYDFIVRPGGDPTQIKITPQGAQPRLASEGDLLFELPGQTITLKKPVAYQMGQGGRQEVRADYALAAGSIGLDVGPYDTSQTLIIDPVVVYAHLLSGTLGSESVYDIAVDQEGCAYITGVTSSADFPVLNPFQNNLYTDTGGSNLGDAFVTKLSAAGYELVYSTFIGGKGYDVAHAIAVDAKGCAIITGATEALFRVRPSERFPTKNAFMDSTESLIRAAFVSKLGSGGNTLLYSSVFGDIGDCIGDDIAVDGAGSIYLIGSMYPQMGGKDFPLRSAFQSELPGFDYNYFVAKFNPALSGDASLIYSSWLGGDDNDGDFGPTGHIAVDAQGCAFCTGITESGNFPILGAISVTRKGEQDAFITKIAKDGKSLIYSSFIGGSGNDYCPGLALDGTGSAYLLVSGSNDFYLSTGAFQGRGWSYLSKVSPEGDRLIYSARLPALVAVGLAVNPQGEAIIAGSAAGKGGSDAALVTLNAEGSDTLETSLFGGSGNEAAVAVAVDDVGAIYLTGSTSSTDLPEVPPSEKLQGAQDLFIAKIISDAIIVNSTGDDPDIHPDDTYCFTGNWIIRDGVGEPEQTLRAALETAYNIKGSRPVVIRFDIPGEEVPVIQPEDTLPWIRRPMTIDGKSQPGTHLVHIEGSKLPAYSGLTIEGTTNVTIRGMMITGFQDWGIQVDSSRAVVIQENFIGMDRNGKDLKLNGKGGILFYRENQYVSQPGDKSTVGGMTLDKQNYIGGGIAGSLNDNLEILLNTILLPEADPGDARLRIPVDMCMDQVPDGVDLSSTMAVAITRLSEKSIEGLCDMDGHLVIYKVRGQGSGAYRYQPAWVEPVAALQVSKDTKLEIPCDLEPGTQISIGGAVIADGISFSRELSQLRAPVIFIPGVGGSWLEGANDDNLWLPTSVTSDAKNAAIKRLTLNEDGTSGAEEVHADEVLERVNLGITTKGLPYYDILARFEEAGYAGDILNRNPESLDVWRFPYDWRKSAAAAADLLKDFIYYIMWESGTYSRSVDIVCHSNGGLVASLALDRRRDRHSPINRLITIGTPYLGTPQAIAAHTRGYIFGADEELPNWSPDWSTILPAVRNWPVAYSLLPSRTYWEAVQLPVRGHALMQDFTGMPLSSYETMFAFLTGPKSRGQQPAGFDRNAAIWSEQQQSIHAVIDDWRKYLGPPLIYRMVGALSARTASGWAYVPIKNYFDPARKEHGDLIEHITYRGNLLPIFGSGDGTVTTGSAALGYFSADGVKDFSGTEESEWIEEMEHYPCDHMGLVANSCLGEDGKPLLEHVIEILENRYKVPGTVASQQKRGQLAAVSGNPVEIFYVLSTAPVQVTVENAAGNQTGPTSSSDLNNIQYDLKGVTYMSSPGSVALALPPDSLYKVTIKTPLQPGQIDIIRQRAFDDRRINVLYDSQTLAKNGGVRLVLASSGTDASVPFELDQNGDGNYESQLAPGAQLSSNLALPSIPFPEPFLLHGYAVAGTAAPFQLSFSLPDVGGPVWNWQLSGGAAWIKPSASSGQTPATVALRIDPAGMSPGTVYDTLDVNLAYGKVHKTVPLVIALTMQNQAAAVAVTAPDRSASAGGGLTLPIELGDPAGAEIFSADIRLTYDSKVLSAREVAVAGCITSGWGTPAVNLTRPGEILIAMAGFSPLAVQGTLANIIFDVPGLAGDTCSVKISSCRLNEGAPAATTRNARISVIAATGVDNNSGLPLQFRLYQNRPNPFNAATELRYELPAAQPLNLSVFDVRGKCVRTLVEDMTAAGVHQILWDGLDESGLQLPTGTYFIRMQGKNEVQTRKALLLR